MDPEIFYNMTVKMQRSFSAVQEGIATFNATEVSQSYRPVPYMFLTRELRRMHGLLSGSV